MKVILSPLAEHKPKKNRVEEKAIVFYGRGMEERDANKNGAHNPKIPTNNTLVGTTHDHKH